MMRQETESQSAGSRSSQPAAGSPPDHPARNICKFYAESFRGTRTCGQIQEDAQRLWQTHLSRTSPGRERRVHPALDNPPGDADGRNGQGSGGSGRGPSGPHGAGRVRIGFVTYFVHADCEKSLRSPVMTRRHRMIGTRLPVAARAGESTSRIRKPSISGISPSIRTAA